MSRATWFRKGKRGLGNHRRGRRRSAIAERPSTRCVCPRCQTMPGMGVIEKPCACQKVIAPVLASCTISSTASTPSLASAASTRALPTPRLRCAGATKRCESRSTPPQGGVDKARTAGAQGLEPEWGCPFAACVCACQGRQCGFSEDDLGGPGHRSGAWAALARAGSGIAKLSKGPPQSASARVRLLRWGFVR